MTKLTRFHNKARRLARQAEAATRARLRAERTDEEQLALIAARPGASARERARLS